MLFNNVSRSNPTDETLVLISRLQNAAAAITARLPEVDPDSPNLQHIAAIIAGLESAAKKL